MRFMNFIKNKFKIPLLSYILDIGVCARYEFALTEKIVFAIS